MKIACVTDDGRTISAHFGRAQYYAVLTVENGQIVNRKMRTKMGHQQFVGQEAHEAHGPGHGMDAGSHDKHTQMAHAIQDCEALLCRGMGRGAYQSMQQIGIKPVVTDIEDIDTAVVAYAQGQLKDHTDLLH